MGLRSTGVYFHKTTRGIEALVKELLRLTLSDTKARKELEGSSSLFHYFSILQQKREELKKPRQNKSKLKKLDQGILQAYLALDDVSFLDALSQIEHGKYGPASLLARRFFARDLFKCFEPSDDPDEIGEKIKKFRSILKGKKIKFYEDITPSKGYKQFEITGEYLKNLLVKNAETGEQKPIGTLNPGVLHLVSKRQIRFYFMSKKDKDAAKQTWKNRL